MVMAGLNKNPQINLGAKYNDKPCHGDGGAKRRLRVPPELDNQHSFSLVLFYLGNPKSNIARVEYLVQILANRIRLTDEVGWYDNQHIGTVLPYTYMAGAKKVANDTCRAISTRVYIG